MRFFSRHGGGRALLLAATVMCVAAVAAVGQVDITEKFKDARFRAYVYSTIGKTAPAPILDSDVKGVKEVRIGRGIYTDISDLSGIEEFTALTTLICYEVIKLTTLDVSKNTALTELTCYRGQLTALDVSKNIALTKLDCSLNPLTALDVSKNTALTKLDCSYNQLTTLDVSENTALTYLNCHFLSKLTTLDVSKNTALTYLDCSANPLITLDVSKNTALTYLDCSSNLLTTLDVSKNTALTELYCSIGYDDVKSNQLTALDVSKNIALRKLDCGRNQLTVLDVSNNTALTSLRCSYNQLTALDVSNNIALTELSCGVNKLTTLDVSKNTALTSLFCSGDYAAIKSNQLTTLDVSKNTALMELYCDNNLLTALDLSKNTALTELDCCRNQLTALDVSNNIALTKLNCNVNKLTTLDVSKNTALTELDCSSDQLTTLDVSKNTALKELNCSSNQLTALDVSKNTALKKLMCSYNQLTVLDLSKNTALASLVCGYQSRYGYFNGGWYIDAEYTETWSGRIITTLYAKWIPIFTITFNANGGTVTPESGDTRADSTLVASSYPTPKRSDYAFNGWFTSETGGEKVTESRKYSANTTIYAQWTQSVYTVTLDPTGGTVTSTTVSIGENKRVVSLPNPTKTGHNFDGWFTAPTGGEKVTEGYVLSGNITVYARWTPTYAITFGTATNGVLTATVDGNPITTGTSIQSGKSVVFTAVPDMGYDVGGWMVNGTLVAEATNIYTLLNVSSTAVVTVSFNLRVIDAVATPDRVVPAVRPGEESAVVAPVAPLTAEFTVGPNPASRSFGTINFFRNGPRISPASLSIYDASGNVVCKVAIKDSAAINSSVKRSVGSWDLRDAKGCFVSDGTYLLRGVVKTKAGKSERVSLVVGVR